MPDRDFVFAPATATVQASVALEPALNVLSMIHLLSYPEERSGFSEWVTKTALALPPERARTHRMIFSNFHGIEQIDAPDFPALVDELAALDPLVLRDRSLEWVHDTDLENVQRPEKAVLLGDRRAYLDFTERLFAAKWAEKEVEYVPALFEEAHRLLNDPPALQQIIVSHLRWIWDQVMQAEWERVLPMLQDSVNAFQQLDLNNLTALEAIRAVTGRDVTGIWDMWPLRLIFVPSAHIGPYLSRFDSLDGNMTRIIFGARLPEGTRAKSPDLDRSELLVRLNALADDIRLQMLELLTQHDELCAQDFINLLNLSQSAASRHLRQLTATGYLIERRREVAKCYTLNPQRVEDTLRALKQFMRAK